MICGCFDSIRKQFGNLVAWKPEKIANFAIFRVLYDCRKQRNVNEMSQNVPYASTLTACHLNVQIAAIGSQLMQKVPEEIFESLDYSRRAVIP